MIRIQNIYYMLSYAFRILQEAGYTQCRTEEFQNTADMLSDILIRGVSIQVKRGLNYTYCPKTESLNCLRGKIELSESIRQQVFRQQQMVCCFDEFSSNSDLNRILKTTMQLLLKGPVSSKRKKKLRNLLLYFHNVEFIPPNNISWHIRYDRNNQSYEMLMAVCRLVILGLLQTTEDGTVKMMQYLDEQQISRLYERFILEYYRKHYPKLNATSSQIKWALDDGFSDFLPIMQSDIMMTYGNKTLIVDAKYYGKVMQTKFHSYSIHSHNLYQIFSYVKNKAVEGGEVAGMLLYAKTEEEYYPRHIYQMSGNQISVRTLDLNCDFVEIATQLDSIVEEHFSGVEKVL